VSDDAARVAELLGVLPEVPPLVHGPEPATPSSRPGAVAVRSLSQADAGESARDTVRTAVLGAFGSVAVTRTGLGRCGERTAL